MKNVIIVIILVFGFSLTIFSANTNVSFDSLQIRLEQTYSDTAKITVLNDIALLLFRTEPSKAKEFAQKARDLSEKEHYFLHQTITNNAYAAASWLLGDYDEATKYIYENIKIYESVGDQRGLAKSYHHLSLIFTEALKIEDALKYSTKAINICNKINNKSLLASAMSQSGLIYTDYKHDNEKAKEYFLASLLIYQDLKDTLKSGYTANNLGRIYYLDKQYINALDYFNRALKVCIKYRANHCICHVLNNIGDIYMSKQEFDKARSYYLQSIDTAVFYKILKLESRSFQRLAQADSSLLDYLSALSHYKKHYQLEQELVSIEKESRISELEIKYDSEKQKQQNLILTKNKKIQDLIVRFMGVAIVLVLIILISVYRLLKIKQKSNVSLNKKNEEIILQKDRINNQNDTLQKQANELFEYKEQLEDLVTQRTIELLDAKVHAEESDKLKTAFLNNISHEYRTPMNGILGFSDLIADPDATEEERMDYSKLIRKSCNKLLHLVVDTVEISKIHTQQDEIIKSPVDIQDIVSAVLSEYAEVIEEKGLQIKYQLKCNLEQVQINTDEAKISRIIGHLIDNAVKFTNKGFVSFLCKPLDNGYLQFEIKDSGIGISEEFLTIIFNPFRQVETSTTRNFGGSGIGLSLVKSYVELLQGEIWINSKLGVGTEVYFTIPMEMSSEIKTIHKINDVNKLENKTILIAEDNEMNYILIDKILSRFNCSLLHAWNGKDAVDYFINGHPIDLVLMDLKMPVLDGYTAAKLIKDINKEIPIIAQTAYTMNTVIKDTHLVTFDGFVTKPIDVKLLLNEILSKI